jgi:hypothetical protein
VEETYFYQAPSGVQVFAFIFDSSPILGTHNVIPKLLNGFNVFLRQTWAHLQNSRVERIWFLFARDVANAPVHQRAIFVNLYGSENAFVTESLGLLTEIMTKQNFPDNHSPGESRPSSPWGTLNQVSQVANNLTLGNSSVWSNYYIFHLGDSSGMPGPGGGFLLPGSVENFMAESPSHRMTMQWMLRASQHPNPPFPSDRFVPAQVYAESYPNGVIPNDAWLLPNFMTTLADRSFERNNRVILNQIPNPYTLEVQVRQGYDFVALAPEYDFRFSSQANEITFRPGVVQPHQEIRVSYVPNNGAL